MKKIISIIAALVIMSVAAVSTVCAEETTATVPVIINTEGGLQFSATVPTALPINVDNCNTVTTAGDLKITNNSVGAICVKSVKYDTTGSLWNLADFSDNLNFSKVNSKKLAISLGTDTSINDFESNGTILLNNDFTYIAPDDFLGLKYKAKVSPQSEKLTGINAGSLKFILDWSYAQ